MFIEIFNLDTQLFINKAFDNLASLPERITPQEANDKLSADYKIKSQLDRHFVIKFERNQGWLEFFRLLAMIADSQKQKNVFQRMAIRMP